MINTIVWAAISLLSLIPLLIAERRQHFWGKLVFKALASTAFILTAISAGALRGQFARWY